MSLSIQPVEQNLNFQGKVRVKPKSIMPQETKTPKVDSYSQARMIMSLIAWGTMIGAIITGGILAGVSAFKKDKNETLIKENIQQNNETDSIKYDEII